jgi:hypothetical protein
MNTPTCCELCADTNFRFAHGCQDTACKCHTAKRETDETKFFQHINQTACTLPFGHKGNCFPPKTEGEAIYSKDNQGGFHTTPKKRGEVYAALNKHFGREIHVGESDLETAREIATLDLKAPTK